MAIYKPLSAPRHNPLGSKTEVGSDLEEDILDLPGSVFFSGRRPGDPAGGPPSLFYKDQVGAIRRVLFTRGNTFRFSPVLEPDEFSAFGEVLFVPELDPRAWAAAKDGEGEMMPELSSLVSGTFFTALGMTESLASTRRGVYRKMDDGSLRRRLQPATLGLRWSDPIPANRLSAFGEILSVPEV